jgi:hypothetical protein
VILGGWEQRDWGLGAYAAHRAHIKEATDGWLSLKVNEIPTLTVHARNVKEIPEVVRTAAAELLGRDPEDFDVEIRY